MHMNKLKHLTPSNIAPLGKRHGTVMSVLPEKRLDLKLEVLRIYLYILVNLAYA